MKSVKTRSFVERYLIVLYLEQAATVRFAGAELVLGSQCIQVTAGGGDQERK